ncbi:hypothetical protein V6N13_018287 [Hibiscus sabdariffa]
MEVIEENVTLSCNEYIFPVKLRESHGDGWSYSIWLKDDAQNGSSGVLSVSGRSSSDSLRSLVNSKSVQKRWKDLLIIGGPGRRDFFNSCPIDAVVTLSINSGDDLYTIGVR